MNHSTGDASWLAATQLTLPNEGNHMSIETHTRPRSMFVTALSWAFIGLGALGTPLFLLMSLASTAGRRSMTHGTSPFGESYRHMAQAMSDLPWPWSWFYAHEAELMLAAAAIALLHFACALGLLWRRPWARHSFMALMLLDILIQGVAMIYTHYMQPLLQQAMLTNMPPDTPPFFTQWMQHVMSFQQIEAIARPVLLAILFGWIAWRLRSAAIRQEFTAAI